MKLLVWGVSGKMGTLIKEVAEKDSYWTSVEGMNRSKTVAEIEKPHVVIDFSHPNSINEVLKYCGENQIPLVIGTTGFTPEQTNLIEETSKNLPILQATNMSLGMNIMFSLVEQVAKMLKDQVDIEVLEAHHNRKKDAPSGSATTIIQSIEKGLGEATKHQHGRAGQCPREKGEIGVHALRGGNIVGLHEAHFINELETIKITHEAHDRSVFAQGAVEAAKFIIGKENGLYNMKNVLGLE